MIIGEQKPIQEIFELMERFQGRRILVIGCDSCMTVSLAGGKEEVRDLVEDIRRHSTAHNKGWTVRGLTLKRQCESRYQDRIVTDMEHCDIVVSLGCGIGAQMMSERFPDVNIVPAINTSNMGAPSDHGVFKEKCLGCGQCTIHRTGGICVLTRCSKGLQNGPCGGSVNGRCEVNPETECAWCQVYEALDKKGELDRIDALIPPKDWSKSHSGGVRTIKTK